MQLFQKLGADVEKLWRDKNYSEDAFPALAAQALKEAEIPSKMSAWEVLSWSLRETILPEQRDLPGKFGDPPITVYNSPRFHIDVYFWLEGTTSIHQHGFCGAFQVMHGSSIHSHYDFEKHEAVNTFTEVGDINLQSCELLNVGQIREILAGREFIHSLFHLDQPSATIVVRTFRSPLHLPQFDYKKPFLALDPFFEEPTTTKKMQSLSALMRVPQPDTDALISEMLEKADFQSTFTILSYVKSYLQTNQMNQLFNLTSPQERFEKFMAIARRRHGSLADILPPVYEHFDKTYEIVKRRSYVTDNEHRFFFALLMNVEGKERILSLIKERFPDADPTEKVLDWTDGLSQTKVFGANISNALGIENFDDFDLFVLESLMRNWNDEEIKQKLETEYHTNFNEDVSNKLKTKSENLRQSLVFAPLFK